MKHWYNDIIYAESAIIDCEKMYIIMHARYIYRVTYL